MIWFRDRREELVQSFHGSVFVVYRKHKDHARLPFFVNYIYLKYENTINKETSDFRNSQEFGFFQQRTRVTALILARGGSKSIKLKNLVKVGNVTLLARSINALFGANAFESIWVSTDHELIAQEARKGGAQVHNRSAESATDEATSIFAVQEFLHYHPEVEVLALVQCTSPFIRAEYLQAAFSEIASGASCAFSVTRSFKLRWKKTPSGLTSLNFNPSRRPRRQDWEGELIENGMFYFAKADLLRRGLFQNDECSAVIVRPEDSLDVDTPWHLEAARAL
ncbi:CMP-sialic acid synthase, partial [Arctopsyche grandis]|uniref:CMP-sialic acid synthase n=1 Tax=Arctopsyche grandis TaxID=121162 RepID=UPI00406D9039